MEQSSGIPYQVRRAQAADAEFLADQVDRYRQFHGEPSDRPRARRFVEKCLAQNDCVFLICHMGDTPTGYLQSYPGLSAFSAELSIVVTSLYVRRNPLGFDQMRALLSEALKRTAQAGYSLLEIPAWGVDDWMQEVVAGFKGRHWPGTGTYAIELPRSSPETTSESAAPISSGETRVDEGARQRRKGYTPPGYLFFRRNGALLEGWSTKRRIHHLEHLHGSDTWTFYWKHPLSGTVRLHLEPADAFHARGSADWTYPVMEKKRFFRKEMSFPMLDFRETGVLRRLDDWVRITLDDSREGSLPTGNEDVPTARLMDENATVAFGTPRHPLLP